MRALVAICVLFAVAIVTAVVMSFVVLDSDWGRDRARIWIQAHANLQIERLRGNLLHGAELDGVTLENGMKIDRARLKWRWYALYGGYIDEARIEKDGVVARGGMQVLAGAVRFWGTAGDWSVRAKIGKQIELEAGVKELREGIADVRLRAHGEGKRGILDALSLRLRGEKWRAVRPAKLRVVDGGLAVCDLLLQKGDERIRIDAEGNRRRVIADASVTTTVQSAIGELPITADLHGSLRSGKLQVDGTMETRAAAYPLWGRIAGKIAVGGTLDHPRPEVKLVGDGLKVELDGEKLPIDARMRVHDGVIDFEQVKLVKDKSLVLASGSAPLDGSSLVALVDAHRMPLQHGQLAAFLDGELLLRMKRDASGKLRGEFSVERGQARLGTLALDRDLQELGPLEDVKFPEEKNENFVLAKADGFSAKITGPFQVRGPDLSVDLTGSVRVENNVARGQIEGKNGWIDVYGHRYQLERVKFSFDDQTVDIRLKRERPEAIVYIDLRGQLDRAKVTLRSDPPIYDQAQLAALVVNGDAGAAQRDDRKELAGALSSAILGRLKSQIAPQLPIDVFKLDSDRVEAGKLLGERLYLAYVHNNTNAPHTNHDQAQAEVRLPRGFRIETNYGDVGGALDVSWLKRF